MLESSVVPSTFFHILSHPFTSFISLVHWVHAFFLASWYPRPAGLLDLWFSAVSVRHINVESQSWCQLALTRRFLHVQHRPTLQLPQSWVSITVIHMNPDRRSRPLWEEVRCGGRPKVGGCHPGMGIWGAYGFIANVELGRSCKNDDRSLCGLHPCDLQERPFQTKGSVLLQLVLTLCEAYGVGTTAISTWLWRVGKLSWHMLRRTTRIPSRCWYLEDKTNRNQKASWKPIES